MIRSLFVASWKPVWIDRTATNYRIRSPSALRRFRVKPGSHERHKHKKTKHDFSSGTCENKTTRIFLCFAFCSAFGLCLNYDLMLMTILMSQAWLHSFVLPFIYFVLLLWQTVNKLHSFTLISLRLKLIYRRYFKYNYWSWILLKCSVFTFIYL